MLFWDFLRSFTLSTDTCLQTEVLAHRWFPLSVMQGDAVHRHKTTDAPSINFSARVASSPQSSAGPEPVRYKLGSSPILLFVLPNLVPCVDRS